MIFPKIFILKMNPSAKKRYPSSYYRLNQRRKTSIRKTTLENGLRVITETTKAVQSFALGICINAGSREDEEKYNGTAHFLEHILFRLSKHGSTKCLNSKFEAIGAYVNAFTAKEYTYYYTRALSQNLKKAFNLLADILFPMEFRTKDIEYERKVILEEIKLYNDDPDELIFDYADCFILGNHPLAKPITGELNSVSEINRRVLERFYKKFYQPQNIIISAVGNVDHDIIVELAVKRFGNLTKKGNVRSRIEPSVHKSVNKNIFMGVQQGYILIGRNVCEFNSEDKYPLIILNEILCDGMSSRLQSKIRDRYGLAYSLESDLYFFSDIGTLYISSVSDMNSIPRIEEIIFNEMEKLQKSGIHSSEFKRAKEQLKSRVMIDNEDITYKMKSQIKNELYLNKYENPNDTIANIDYIKIEDIHRVISKYLDTKDWSIIKIMPER